MSLTSYRAAPSRVTNMSGKTGPSGPQGRPAARSDARKAKVAKATAGACGLEIVNGFFLVRSPQSLATTYSSTA
jgi:hypothetical protein